MAKSRLLIEDYAGVAVVTFQDSSILDMRVIDQIGQDLFHLTDAENKRRLVLDFSNVKFLASHALGILLDLNKKAKAIEGELLLCGIRPELRKVFTLTKLDSILKLFTDDAAALAHFNVHVQ